LLLIKAGELVEAFCATESVLCKWLNTAVESIASNDRLAKRKGVAVPIAQVYDRSPLVVNPEGDLVQTVRALDIYTNKSAEMAIAKQHIQLSVSPRLILAS